MVFVIRKRCVVRVIAQDFDYPLWSTPSLVRERECFFSFMSGANPLLFDGKIKHVQYVPNAMPQNSSVGSRLEFVFSTSAFLG